jgi:Holliday junction resolvasome RuvABC ATP-dependent DNA helicase subunit
MAKADTLPVQIKLSEAQYLVLLKHAKNNSRVAARLLRAVEHETSLRKGKRGPYTFTGFVTDALSLRALALVHAPDAVPAIEKALKRAREK